MARGKDEVRVAVTDQDIAQQEWDVALVVVREHKVEVTTLWVQVAELEAQARAGSSAEVVSALVGEQVQWFGQELRVA
ncbi:hypothetical protein C0993_011477, partial [Termitomyces sp. T159_Od127]